MAASHNHRSGDAKATHVDWSVARILSILTHESVLFNGVLWLLKMLFSVMIKLD